MRLIELTRGKTAIVDDADFEELALRKWYASHAANGFYAAARIDGSIVHMHRLILKAELGSYVDHINRDTLDNRRENLRICSQSQNLANCKLQSRNKSGFKGVYYCAVRRKWIAQKRINKKTVNLGGFATAQDAALAYDAAAIAHFGDYALTNKKLGLI